MSIALILILTIAVLLLAYRVYGRYIAGRLRLDDRNTTPAHVQGDGKDYVPTKKSMLLGHHFASIAGAGPIVGPVIAAAFGWIPALIWIIVGGIFFGAVHDFTSLVASLRHRGKSIGSVIEQYIGNFGKRLFLVFSFATLVLVIAVFADIVAKTFESVPSSASSSILFVLLALLFGFILNRTRIPFWLSTSLGIVSMYAMVWMGHLFPLDLGYGIWLVILFLYVFVAAIAPVSALLQPRDFLNSFLLYGMMLFGVLGIAVGRPNVVMDSSIHLEVETLGYIFPVLFVTIACGAISGFHALVASGTTSKQIDRESDARVIGFGGMLIETLLAVMALSSVLVLSRGEYLSRLPEAGPVTLFAEGIGGFMASLGISPEIGVSFVALTVSAFALTTLDTCTRLARYTLEEYFDGQLSVAARTIATNPYVSTSLAVLLSAGLVLSGEFGALWPIFGSANQLLGALALLAVTVWLMKLEIRPIFTLVPMVFMFAVTLASLFLFAWKNFSQHAYLLGAMATGLFALSVVLIVLARRSLNSIDEQLAMEAT